MYHDLKNMFGISNINIAYKLYILDSLTYIWLYTI